MTHWEHQDDTDDQNHWSKWNTGRPNRASALKNYVPAIAVAAAVLVFVVVLFT